MAIDYAALADTIKIEDITSDELNRQILQRLKDNDENLDNLSIMDNNGCDGDDYIPIVGEDIGWLGYFIGNNTELQMLNFNKTINDESFYKEICHNKSIEAIRFSQISLDGEILSMLDPFFQNSHNLTRFTVDGCELIVNGARQLSLAIGSCNKLKHIEITNNEMMDGQLVDVITALSIHPQLEELDLSDNGISMGRNECTALSTLLRCTTTQLKALILYNSNINDVGIGLLLSALRGHALQKLNLGSNLSLTMNGWKSIAALLEMPGSSLKELKIHGNNIGDEGAQIFANALANNSTLKQLDLDYCGVTREGWAPFSKLLCDTSTINKTYLSNHTLENVGHTRSLIPHLKSNKMLDKGKLAIIKILQNHSHFNMEPFFEWEFKVLPLMIRWFAKVDVNCLAFDLVKVSRMKLSAVYDFIKGFPMLYIESVTRKEIAKCNVLEEQLQGGEELEKIRQHKARALRRLS